MTVISSELDVRTSDDLDQELREPEQEIAAAKRERMLEAKKTWQFAAKKTWQFEASKIWQRAA